MPSVLIGEVHLLVSIMFCHYHTKTSFERRPEVLFAGDRWISEKLANTDIDMHLSCDTAVFLPHIPLFDG